MQAEGGKTVTFRDLQDEMWKSLPPLRRNLVGRERIDELVVIAIDQCPIQFVEHVSRGSCEQSVVLSAWSQSVKRAQFLRHGEQNVQFGPLFWILVGPLLQILLQKLLDWWFASAKNRVLMVGWQRSMNRDR
jgi:hypothetical protein